jgi:hypothetical protein
MSDGHPTKGGSARLKKRHTVIAASMSMTFE